MSTLETQSVRKIISTLYSSPEMTLGNSHARRKKTGQSSCEVVAEEEHSKALGDFVLLVPSGNREETRRNESGFAEATPRLISKTEQH